ncbi:MAG: hypothetical protein ACTSU4_10975 [Promethearchaeota archaeon]
MIPFYNLPNLRFNEVILFEFIHTSFHYVSLLILLQVGLYILLRDINLINRRYMLITGVIIELSEIFFGFFSSFFLIGGAIALLYNVGMTWSSEFLILYLRYYKKELISLKGIFFLFLLIFPATYFFSLNLTIVFFNLFGKPNSYIGIFY